EVAENPIEQFPRAETQDMDRGAAARRLNRHARCIGCEATAPATAYSTPNRTATMTSRWLNRTLSVLGLGAAAALAACAGVSQQQEVQMGKQEAAQVKAQLPILQNPVINNYVSNLGRSIASHTSRADLDWKFHVVNSDIVNAFALPGGFIYVNRGVLDRASNE